MLDSKAHFMRKHFKAPLVSAIIPTYNLKKIALECVYSLIKQDYHNTEIIVIDNGNDGTYLVIKKRYPQVKVYKSRSNLGSTGGMNAGLEKAKGSFLWFIDHDNILKPNMLSELMKLALSDPQIGIVAPKIYYWEDKKRIWSAGASVGNITGINYSREGNDVGQYNRAETIDIAPANFLVKKEVINKVGFYDNIYWLSYEDADWCARVRKNGYKIMYSPSAICYHKMPVLNKSEGKRRWLARAYLTARNKIIFMRKNSPYFSLFVLLYPAWFILYTLQSIKYKDFDALRNFYKGIFDGFKWAFTIYGMKSNIHERYQSKIDHLHSLLSYELTKNVKDIKIKKWVKSYLMLLTSRNYIASNYDDIIFFLKNGMRSNQRLLDFGTGGGYIAYLLAQNVKKVTAYEYIGNWTDQQYNNSVYKEAFSCVQGRTQILEPKISFKFYSSFPLKESSNTFEAIILYAVLEHVEDTIKDQILAELHRILKPNGFLFIAKLPRLYSWQEFVARKFGFPSHSDLYTRNKITKLLSKNGFNIRKMESTGLSTNHIQFNNKITKHLFPLSRYLEGILSYTPLIWFSHDYRIIASKEKQ